MSENNLPVPEPTTDFTESDLKAIDQFVEDGLPGVSSVDDARMTRIMDLYLGGKTYRQISLTMRISKSLILYLSKRFDWYNLRKEYLSDLEQSIRGRLIEAKVVNQDFLLELSHHFKRKIGKKINEYMATGNEEYANAIDLKEVDKYLKIVESLHRLSTEGGKGDPKALIGLNAGDGMTIRKTGENEIEITPKNKAIGDVLKQLADLRREEEKNTKK